MFLGKRRKKKEELSNNSKHFFFFLVFYTKFLIGQILIMKNKPKQCFLLEHWHSSKTFKRSLDHMSVVSLTITASIHRNHTGLSSLRTNMCSDL